MESDEFGQAYPGGQGVQFVAAASLNVPATHSRGLPEVVGHLKPGSHGVQLREFLTNAYCPKGQG